MLDEGSNADRKLFAPVIRLMTQASRLQAAALQRLASVSPQDLVKVTASGHRLLYDLFVECAQARLCHAAGASDDLQRLHAVFTVALNNGLGSLIHDYVVEVCSDSSFTSR